ncbi:FtsX-like permease family protein [Clostridium estertheticum]|uniref:FtsX-like permease family protein n=1 Tax=Clostridium estertheticum TaxID=238834 RepID=UPI001C7CC5C0|nr:ABC transporter permease [Clostridium estertheticum]MBX4260937.1 FtsX-like permease family protein [Clostridium estertheticum]WLC71783.1 FtsX-like permease family protein [Clostridium estertheticum]
MEYINKQIKKDFMKNKSYVLVIVLMALFTTSMFLFIRYSVDKNVKNVSEYIQAYNQEDFRFKVDVFYDKQLRQKIIRKYNISEEDIKKYGIETIIKNKNIDVSEFETQLAKKLGNKYSFMFAKRSIKKIVNGDKTYYFINNLTDINKTNLLEGRLPKKDDEIAILPGYAKKNGVNIGDTIKINETAYTITGYIYLPDYIAFVPYGELEQTFDNASFVIAGGNTFNLISGNLTEYFCGKYNKNVNARAIKSNINNTNNNKSFKYFEESSKIDGDSLPTMGLKSNRSLAFTFLLSFLVVTVYVYSMFYKKFIQLYRKKFGLYKALGFTTGKIVKVLLRCTLPYIFIGNILGTVTGYFLSSVLVNRFVETYCFDGFTKGCNISTYSLGIFLLPVINIIVILIYISHFYKEDASLLMKSKVIKNKMGLYTSFCNVLCRLVPEKNKVSYRMLFRKKSNIIMSFGAVAIVSTLFVTSISLYRSSGYAMDNQFEGVSYKAKAISETYTDDRDDYEDFIQVSAELLMKDEKNNFDIIGLQKNSKYMKLRNESKEITIVKDSFIISKGVSILYNLKKGDQINLKLNGLSNNETITDVCSNGGTFMVYTSKEKLAGMVGVSKMVHNGVFYSTDTIKASNNYTKIITLDEEKAVIKVGSSSNQSSAIINQVIAVISGLVLFYLAIQAGFQDSEKDILIMRKLGYSGKEIFRMIIDVYKGLIIVFYLLTYPVAMYISKSIHVSISKQTNDYIPFSTNIFIFVAGFILILTCYELIVTCFKLQMSKKLNQLH